MMTDVHNTVYYHMSAKIHEHVNELEDIYIYINGKN